MRGADFESNITKYAERMQDDISADTLDDAINFLSSLSIFTTGGDARSFRAQVIEEVARPILSQLGARPGLARTAYQAVHGLVLEAVRGLDPRECNVDWYSGDEAVISELARRKITRDRLIQCLADNGISVPQESMLSSIGHETKMIRKLRAGGMGPTVLSVAPRIRQQWYELEVTMRPDIPSLYGDEIDRIRAEVGVCAGEAELRHRTQGKLYGVQMHRELSEQLGSIAPNARIRPSSTELLGCAYQLTDECEIWWSDQFDPSDDAPWIVEQNQETSSSVAFTQEALPFD
jgi:hypothetical protein